MKDDKKARRSEINRRYYDAKKRKVHLGPLAPACRHRGPVGPVVTCKTCLMIQKARRVGSTLNEWEQKRLAALLRAVSAEKSRLWRQRNPEASRAASRRYREANRDVLRVINREFREKNREAIRAAAQRRYQANAQAARQRARDYYAANRERCLETDRRYRRAKSQGAQA